MRGMVDVELTGAECLCLAAVLDICGQAIVDAGMSSNSPENAVRFVMVFGAPHVRNWDGLLSHSLARRSRNLKRRGRAHRAASVRLYRPQVAETLRLMASLLDSYEPTQLRALKQVEKEILLSVLSKLAGASVKGKRRKPAINQVVAARLVNLCGEPGGRINKARLEALIGGKVSARAVLKSARTLSAAARALLV